MANRLKGGRGGWDNINNMLNKDTLLKYRTEKKIAINKHPDYPLFIYNYTPMVQFSRQWDEVTRQCRGLILDDKGNIVARPFPKFFNLSEHKPEDIPNTGFTKYEKIDGSLGIIYQIDTKLFIATRGSFTSEQSIKATELLYTKYADSINYFKTLIRHGYTPLVEIVYKSNQIVVNYNEEQLYVIAVIDNKTGVDIFPQEKCSLRFYHPIPEYEIYDNPLSFTEIQNWAKLNEENKEGFVLHFPNEFRVKVKFEEYCRLHKIMTGFNEKKVWEYLSKAEDIDNLLKSTPDEFYQEMNKVVVGLRDQFNKIETETKQFFNNIIIEGVDDRERKKSFALQALQTQYPNVLFAMYNGKDYKPIIWNIIEPKSS